MQEALPILSPRALGSWTTRHKELNDSSRGPWLLTSHDERCGPVFTLRTPGSAVLFLDGLSGGRQLAENSWILNENEGWP